MNIFQTDPLYVGVAQSMNSDGCAFSALANYRNRILKMPWTVYELGEKWFGAMVRFIVSGDKNGDGDLKDAGESTIQDWNLLAIHLGLPLRYKGKFGLDYKPAPDDFILQSWYNPLTGFIHWVDGFGQTVYMDPIGGGSRTVREGHPYNLQADGAGGIRVFEKKAVL